MSEREVAVTLTESEAASINAVVAMFGERAHAPMREAARDAARKIEDALLEGFRVGVIGGPATSAGVAAAYARQSVTTTTGSGAFPELYEADVDVDETPLDAKIVDAVGQALGIDARTCSGFHNACDAVGTILAEEYGESDGAR